MTIAHASTGEGRSPRVSPVGGTTERSEAALKIRELFASDVTRTIPPVVYFHEQSPEKVAAEVAEYIITGGYRPDHPDRERLPQGIHEQYVNLLNAIADELDRPGGPELPTAWISGFYGSGKSSFAKLLGLALDNDVVLPDGRSVAAALLARDTSPLAPELSAAWSRLKARLDPIAVIFDVGSVAREGEQIHATALRRVQQRLGYAADPLVADFELRLEREGDHQRFLDTAQRVLGAPWAAHKDHAFADDDFSRVISSLYPDRYPDPSAWLISRAGTHQRTESPEEAVKAIGDMLRYRRPGATLFLVVDEVSQYVLASTDRVDRLRAFASALGAGLRGRAWLFALGQQKLDEQAGDQFLAWAKDRFPPRLRVHLAATNIRDVVHRRLLHKTPAGRDHLRRLFEAHRADLKLYAYGCEDITPDDFAEVYPLLPGHIDLILRITSALRLRSTRAQGDDQAIRGLLQLLGELFRGQRLAEGSTGDLVTLAHVYDAQHTALDTDVQNGMARIHEHCGRLPEGARLLQAARAVALLELIQEDLGQPINPALVARCLYDRVDRGSNLAEVTTDLEALHQRNLLSYTEKQGYKIQSPAGEEWERDRRDLPGASLEEQGAMVQDALKRFLDVPDTPRLQGRPFPWHAVFSDGDRTVDATLKDPRKDAPVRLDFRFINQEDARPATWITRSDEPGLRDRLILVVHSTQTAREQTRELFRSRAMVRRYEPRQESLNLTRKYLLLQEKARVEELEKRLLASVQAAFYEGTLYFRGRAFPVADQGGALATALSALATRLLPDLFPHFTPLQIEPRELEQLLKPDLIGISAKFLPEGLGLIEVDGKRLVATGGGPIPRRIQDRIEAREGDTGAGLIDHFGAPPFGYTADVVKACVLGLLRAGRIRLRTENGSDLTAFRDVGAKEVFEKDRAFRTTQISPLGDTGTTRQDRARICKLFAEVLHVEIDREDHLIADEVARHFPERAHRLRDVHDRLKTIQIDLPRALATLTTLLEDAVRLCRSTAAVVEHLKRHLDALRDGLILLARFDAELTTDTLQAVREARTVRDHHLAQLRAEDALTTELAAAADRLTAHLESDRPWLEVQILITDLDALRRAYASERRRRLLWQEDLVEQARIRIKAREGFATLTGEQSHRVLRPLASAGHDTTEQAIAPELADLHDAFRGRLQRAEVEAHALLDEVLRPIGPQLVVVDLGLKNREIKDEKDVEKLVADIGKRLLDRLRTGVRIRLN